MTLVERDNTVLEAGLGRIRGLLDRAVAKGRLTQDGLSETLGRLSGHADLVAMAEVDLVIEAVVEEMDVKKQIFSQLDAIVRDDAILADEYVLPRPERDCRRHGRARECRRAALLLAGARDAIA